MMESKIFPKQTNRQGENKQRQPTIDFFVASDELLLLKTEQRT